MGATAEPTDRQTEGPDGERHEQGPSQQQQIDDLLAEYEESQGEEESPSPEPDRTQEEPEESTPQDEEPVDRQQEGESPEEEEEEEDFERPEEEEREEPEAEEPEEEGPTTEDLMEEIRELKKRNAQLEEQIESDETPTEQEAAETESQEQEEEEPASDLEEAQFINEEDHEEILNNADSMNELLQAMASQIEQRILTQIPELVERTAQRQVSNQQIIQEFWEQNPELREHQEFVQHVANKVEAENPEMAMREALNETAKRAKKELRIKEEAEERESQRQEGDGNSQTQTSSPSTARKPRGRRGGQPEDTRDDQQQQIDSLIGDQL